MTSKDFGTKVKRANFNRSCGSKIYPTLWVPKFRYVAPVIGLEKTKCDEIDKPVLAQCLPETGININFPRDVVLGSTLYGGI